ncbi:MAG: alpha/beta hydrolase [Gammaproteobacteria bacterium]|jgi:pimeloyl-ACP methyl ester carboxylesterase|nr:alpha/beta hydrolase [Gammaproteobacteria bacterium]
MVDFPEPQMIAVNGVELEVFSAGAGKPIVLCHGWPEHAFSWRHQVQPLVQAGYHVIVPNQRGYGHSSKPEAVTDYDINHLTGDLIALLDHFGYTDACFVGHDWGAIIVWNLAMMYRDRVSHVINLSVPFMERGNSEWIGFWEKMLGPDFYMVHFNRQPGVADEVFAKHSKQFLNNMYRTNQWLHPKPELGPGMNMINMASDPALAAGVPGDPIMSDAEMQVFLNAFALSGFTGGINWYRNLSRNWAIMGAYEQHIYQPTLAIFGEYDMVPKSKTLAQRVSNLEEADFPCGHWIQQEKPAQTNAVMLDWLARHYA